MTKVLSSTSETQLSMELGFANNSALSLSEFNFENQIAMLDAIRAKVRSNEQYFQDVVRQLGVTEIELEEALDGSLDLTLSDLREIAIAANLLISYNVVGVSDSDKEMMFVAFREVLTPLITPVSENRTKGFTLRDFSQIVAQAPKSKVA